MAQNTNALAETMTALIDSDTDMDGKFLTFYTDRQLHGVPIADVVQIVGMQEITEIPEYPAYAKGIINLRGSIIPVIDVRLRFGKPETAYNERTCIIVTSIQEAYIGFIVDEVDEVMDVGAEQISLPPKLSQEHTNQYLTGIAHVGNQIVLLMDTAKMLSDQQMGDLLTSVTTAD